MQTINEQTYFTCFVIILLWFENILNSFTNRSQILRERRQKEKQTFRNKFLNFLTSIRVLRLTRDISENDKDNRLEQNASTSPSPFVRLIATTPPPPTNPHSLKSLKIKCFLILFICINVAYATYL